MTSNEEEPKGKGDVPRRKIEQVSFAERLKHSLGERDPEPFTLSARASRGQTRRDFLLLGAGAALAGAGLWWTLPDDVQMRLGDKHAATGPRKNRILNESIHFDDDVSEALYSPTRHVPTFHKRDAQTPDQLMNNYNGPTPDGSYLSHWHLVVTGLASGRTERLKAPDIRQLVERYGSHDNITQLTCVEGWRAIAWWSGLRFADFLQAFPPAPGMKWAEIRSDVNLGTDGDGNAISDPYYVSIDLPTAQHPQTLLATHQSDHPLTLGHGAPLRLIAPMKLGLKNIKAITSIAYTASEPRDYWYERGYSHYDGL